MKEKLSDKGTDFIFEEALLSAGSRKKLYAAGKWMKNSKRKAKAVANPKLANTLLFYGPNILEQTRTAAMLSEQSAMEFYRVDLSQVISKYIGETEKNLEMLFANAEDKKWVLFFDEADALFGKRTDVKNAHDRYSNLDTTYLLQKIESFEGLVILATNQKKSIDPDFKRRLRTTIYFRKPKHLI